MPNRNVSKSVSEGLCPWALIHILPSKFMCPVISHNQKYISLTVLPWRGIWMINRRLESESNYYSKNLYEQQFWSVFFFFSRQNSQSTVRCLISYLTDCHESYDPQMITNDFCDPLPFLQRQQVNALTYTNTFVISYHKFRKIYFFFIFIL